MAIIEFKVRGTPQGQPRPRAFYNKKLGQARIHEAGTAENWKSHIANAATPHIPKSPWEGPVAMLITFMFRRPEHHYRTGAHAGELKSWTTPWHDKRPDADNVEKALLDAMTALGFWRDDSQVVWTLRSKQYGVVPGAVVALFSFDEFKTGVDSILRRGAQLPA